MQITPSWLSWPETRALIAAFPEGSLRFVGGCVRDAVLGKTAQDVDAATTLPPERVMALLQEHHIKAIPTGLAHGTVTAVTHGKHFEVTTLRRDVATDGRHATVAYTDNWQEDAARRDFTMNALYCDPHGHVTDYFGGVEDAKAGRVRFIGDAAQRIREDGLRILRFFRFFAHYGKGGMDTEGRNACSAHASMLAQLSGERIQQEMLKLLVAERAAAVLEAMQQGGVLEPVLGCHVDTLSLTQLTLLIQEVMQAPDPILALAALLRSTEGDGEARAAFIGERWKLSNTHRKQLQGLVSTKLQLTHHEALTKRQIRVLGKERFIQLMLLYAAEGAEHDSVIAAIALARGWEIPVFPVTGDDVKAHGISQGKAVGDALKTLETHWEKGGYTANKEALLALLGQL